MALTHNLKYESQSQRYRNQKIIETLSKLKFFLHNHPDLKKEIVKEFLVKNKIAGKEFYSDEKLDNFARYIRKGISIKPNKTMKDIIIEGTNFTTDRLIEIQQEEEQDEIEQRNKEKDIKDKGKAKIMKPTVNANTNMNVKANVSKEGMQNEMKKSRLGNNTKRVLIYASSSQLVYDMNEQKKKLFELNPEDKPVMQPEDHIQYLKGDIENLNKKASNQQKVLDKCAERMYYDQKYKYDEAHLKDVAKRKSKLLEFIVYENALAMKQFNEDAKILVENQLK